jgi:hypothetical protein
MKTLSSNLEPFLTPTARPVTWVFSPMPVWEKAHFKRHRQLWNFATPADASCIASGISNLPFRQKTEAISLSAVCGVQ